MERKLLLVLLLICNTMWLINARKSINSDLCALPKVAGPCKAALKRYYFNGKECKQFTYGGCRGNGNNFEFLSECRKVCKS